MSACSTQLFKNKILHLGIHEIPQFILELNMCCAIIEYKFKFIFKANKYSFSQKSYLLTVSPIKQVNSRCFRGVLSCKSTTPGEWVFVKHMLQKPHKQSNFSTRIINIYINGFKSVRKSLYPKGRYFGSVWFFKRTFFIIKFLVLFKLNVGRYVFNFLQSRKSFITT